MILAMWISHEAYFLSLLDYTSLNMKRQSRGQVYRVIFLPHLPIYKYLLSRSGV